MTQRANRPNNRPANRRTNRRTKIVATLGPGSAGAETIGQLIAAGVDVFRLNFSHGSSDDHAAVAQHIREQAKQAGRPVGILADLQGPKIRIASFREGNTVLVQGQDFSLRTDIGESDGDQQAVSYSFVELPDYLDSGDTLLLDDGRIRLRVASVTGGNIDCTVLVGGRLGSRKGINKLGGGIAAPALTAKDQEDIAELSRIDPDFVAVSFVSSTADIALARELLDKQGLSPAIIAKIERAEVVADEAVLDSILDSADGIMVARGDLGVEVGDAELIGIQKDLIARARKADRLVITATQMMESMIDSPMPTRAEVFDVANAVLDGTDAVMLSAETAVGRYPVEVVRAMADAAMGAERHPVARTSRYRLGKQFGSAQEAIALSAIYAANHYDRVRGIACLTESGTTPRLMSRLSSGLPIFALSAQRKTLQQLTLCRGVIPLLFSTNQQDHALVENEILDVLRHLDQVAAGDELLLTRGDVIGLAGGTNMLKLLPVS